MSSDSDCDIGNAFDNSDYSDEYEVQKAPKKGKKNEEEEEDAFEVPVKKKAKAKTAQDPKASKPKAKGKVSPVSAQPNSPKNPISNNRIIPSLGPKLNLPPPRRCGLSKRAILT